MVAPDEVREAPEDVGPRGGPLPERAPEHLARRAEREMRDPVAQKESHHEIPEEEELDRVVSLL